MTEKVKFDPGYGKFVMEFPPEFQTYLEQIKTFKAKHTQKFEMTRLESAASGVLSQIAGVCQGCILWGAYLSNFYKDAPAEIEGNKALEKPTEQLEHLNYAREPEFLLEFIAKMEKDCKYFLGRPFKLEEKNKTALKDYIDFVNANNQFKDTRTTADIKLPESFKHYCELKTNDLEELHAKIKEVIASDSIEKIFEIGF